MVFRLVNLNLSLGINLFFIIPPLNSMPGAQPLVQNKAMNQELL